MKIEEINAESLKKVSDQEVLSLHHRVHQLAPAVKRDGKHEGLNWEDLVNAHLFLLREMDRRKMNHEIHDELDQSSEELKKSVSEEFASLPKEVVIVPDFVSVVGSSVSGEGHDIDILFRADRVDDKYLIQSENVWLPVRNVFGKDKPLTFIDNPQGAHADYIPLYDLVLRKKENYEIKTIKSTIEPITKYTVQKPLMAGYTDTFSLDELWGTWGSKQNVSIFLSPKIDGFRCILQKKGDGTSIYFEDSKEEKDLPELKNDLLKLPDCILEGEFQVKQGDKYLARPEILSYLAGKIEGNPVVFLYDILYWEKDIHQEPFSERLRLLQNIKSDHLVILPQKEVNNKEDFLKAGEEILNEKSLNIEGVVARRSDMPYTFGATGDYAKFKIWVELKVQVLKVEEVENGYTYECGLKQGDNVVSLGKTFVTKEKLADEGDTLNVTVEELLLYPDGSIAWGKPYPQGVDKSRPCYTVEQAVDMARRGRILKEITVKALREAETRADVAEKFWQENWWKCFPKSGKGRWTYQHHFKGLSEEETKLSDEELLKTNHSLHGDLRFEADKGLWGFTAYLGSTDKNREKDRLLNLSNENLRGSFKLIEPREWLEVDNLVVEPGGPGSTEKTWSKFFIKDKGTYDVGVWREHMFENFLNGEHIKGRILIEYAPLGGERVWIIDKPEDQTPYAEKHDKEEVISELKQKGQDYLVWSKPGQKPELIEVKMENLEKSWFVPILKSDEEHFVLGPFLVPDEEDLQGDIVSAEEIEKATHKFMEDYQQIGDMHRKLLPDNRVSLVECYIARGDWEINGNLIKKGTALLGVKIHDPDLWEEIKKNTYKGFSVSGRAREEK